MTPRKSFILEYHRLKWFRPVVFWIDHRAAEFEQKIIRHGEWTMHEHQAEKEGRKLLQEAI